MPGAIYLTARQEARYSNRILVVRAAAAVDPETKERSDDSFAQVAQPPPCGLAPVPAAYQYTQNDSDPSGIGRLKRRTALTEDQLKVPSGVDLQDGDWVIDVTPDSDNYGECSKVQGQPRKRPTLGNRQTNEQAFQLMSEEAPPFVAAAVIAGAARPVDWW